jgi:hypothetical protein
LSLKEAASAQSFQVTRAGFYDVHRANGKQELVAVHPDRRESNLAVIAKEDLDLWRNTGKGVGPEPTGAPGDPQSHPRSLWRYALFVLLLIALTESLFAARYLSLEKDAVEVK